MSKKNAGFHIVMEEAYTCEEDRKYGIALGAKTTIYGEEWVTWAFTEYADGDCDYYWGHYFNDPLGENIVAATKNYHERLAKAYDRLLGGE